MVRLELLQNQSLNMILVENMLFTILLSLILILQPIRLNFSQVNLVDLEQKEQHNEMENSNNQERK